MDFPKLCGHEKVYSIIFIFSVGFKALFPNKNYFENKNEFNTSVIAHTNI